MSTKYIHIILLLIGLTVKVNAQYIPIVDNNFKNYLCNNTNGLLSLDCTQIDTTASKSFTGGLYLGGKSIEQIPEIIYFHQIDTLDATNNNISVLPELKTLNLVKLDLKNNGLTTLSDISHMNKISILNIELNQISKFPNVENSKNTVKHLIFKDNELHSIPDYFKDLTNLTQVQLAQNFLSFEDFHNIIKHPNYGNFTLVMSNQKAMTKDIIIDTFEFSDVTLQLPVDDTITTNIYTWYKDNLLLETTTENKLTLHEITTSEQGVYTVEITNTLPEFAGILLNSGKWTISTTDCQSIINYDISSNNYCDKKEIVITNINQTNTTKPFDILLYSSETNPTKVNTNQAYELNQDDYMLGLSDNENCTTKVPLFNGKTDFDAPCKTVFSPNQDGFEDSYLIKGNGKGTIQDKYGQIVLNFEAPYLWDGKNKTNRYIPIGVYAITIENKLTEIITIVK